MKKKRNLFDCIPEKIRDEIRREDNNISVLLPRFTWGPLKKYLLPLMKSPIIKFQLDTMGTCVWETIDGEKTVLEISKEVCQKTQSIENEEWHQRMGLFMKMLKERELIRFS
ncbi:MAG: PqqD family protein [Planctomycetes bacterium]|nr:PqqD family protein [Planctomycetota bacterium]HNZ65797.1 PqqD family protein [Planctomycetota bacterium]HON44760.1 PqqD family protein [Planctomycetota bacterium]HPY75667.1 PqqD family protein [Planctomycetota bacterium]HQB01216.1 PqqD family protein [Planctomycetota bacterium]